MIERNRKSKRQLKRILFITNGFPFWGDQGAGGIGEFTFTLASELSKAGIKAYVLGCSKDVQEAEHKEASNLVTHVIPFLQFRIGSEYLNRIRLNILIFKYVLLKRIQIVETASYLGWVWPFRPPIPMVVRLHSASTIDVINDQHLNTKIPQRITFELKLIDRASILVSVCDYVKSGFQTSQHITSKNNIITIYNGIDTEKYRPDPSRRSPYHVLLVGNVVRAKGIEDALLAWGKVIEMIPEARLTVVGSIQSAYARAIIERYKTGFGDNISFVGVVANSDLPKYYGVASVFISASHYEANPLVILEAMSSGCAVVCPDHTGFQEIISQGLDGILCDTTDAIVFSQVIIKLLQDTNLREKLGIAARNTILEKFNFYKQLKQNIDLYENYLK
ncbi:MAG: glycosyltransferase family 4 protein [Candidatus Marinimicrobia bacterium]|nr:glycosyltransferase family 4 protein [Candidatus Neomarinimicrobiota bacterium]